MKIEIIGSKGSSYAGVEDLVREFGPRFVRDGHEYIIHGWANKNFDAKGVKYDVKNGVKIIFHKTTNGKFTAQFIVALKASIMAAFSDCDIIFYIFIQNAIFSFIPRIFGKKIFSNLDGMMWKDPKWPWGFRQSFFGIGAYLSIIFSNKTITDSHHMRELYKRKFHVNIDWIGYGCNEDLPEKRKIKLCDEYPNGYYLIMSRVTPHNLTDILVEGFIKSNTESHLIIAGHTPDNTFVNSIKNMANGHNVTFMGLVKDQNYLTQIILNAKAYLHGHSLGGINPALVRVAGADVPAICIDTVFNREVVEYPNHKLQAMLFNKNSDSVAGAISGFENQEEYNKNEAKILGSKVRETMSWEVIYQKYKKYMEDCFRDR